MAEKNESSPFAIPTTVVLVAAAAVAWYRYVRPLDSARPNVGEFTQQAVGEQRIRSRLWQDPFEAVAERNGKAHQDDPAKLAELLAVLVSGGRGKELKPVPTAQHAVIERVRTLRKERPDENILLMPVMVEHGPYADEAEWCRRCRYATISALVTAG
ncbi:MAG TPA: hypothetical protein VG269_04050 [Tepidisphaeraceae bacterium]|nr:hypothetical protein [Tepidisphaeraceae bacterium]